MSKTIHVAIMSVLAMLLFATVVPAQSVEELMNEGVSLLQNGAYDQAITKFRKVLSRDPGNFEAQYNLAFAYMNDGRVPTAIQEFKKALAINQQCTECWGSLAVAYESQGQDDQALGALHEAVRANPGNIEARINLATMYANKNRLNDAVAQYKQIIQIDGRNVDAHVNLAKCLVTSGKIPEAKGYLKTAMSIDPADAEAVWEMANITWKTEGNEQEALKLYRQAVTLQPNSQVYYDNLGLLLEDMDKKQDAIDVWKKYLVYLDDALKKERIEERIAMLERGETPAGGGAPEKLFTEKDRSKDIAQLKNDVGSSRGEGGSNVKMIAPPKSNVANDLEGMDDNSGSGFDLDLQKAAKKKASERKEQKK